MGRCFKCKKTLTAATINEHQNQEFCIGEYGGIVTQEDIRKKEEEEKRRLERAERAKRERRCPTCDMKAYPDDSVKVSDVHFHKVCLKCSECARTPDEHTPMMMGPKNQDNFFGQENLQPFCKFCFAKKFKVSAINIAETVTITPEFNAISL